MILIAAVDNRNGLAFNHRRVSRDREVIRRILSRTERNVLWVQPYSAELFGNPPPIQVRVTERPLEKAGMGEFCFVEREDPGSAWERVESLILFRWNRTYPYDCKLNPEQGGAVWAVEETLEYPGSSHDTITELRLRRIRPGGRGRGKR